MKWSVRSRILGSILIVAAIGLGVAGGTAYLVQRDRAFHEIDDRLRSRIEAARLVISQLQPGAESTATALKEPAVLTTTSALEGVLGRVIPNSNESALGILGGKPAFVPGVEIDFHLEDDPAFVARLVSEGESGGVHIGTALTSVGNLRYISSALSSDDGEKGIYVAAIDIDAELSSLDAVFQTYALVALASLLAIGLVGWFVAGRLLRPIRNLRDAASRITANELHERIPVQGRDDVSDLAGTVNEMLDRLDLAITGQRQLLDDVRHELMTPITIVRGQLELLNSSNAEDVESIRALAIDELDRMTGLVDDIEALAETRIMSPDRGDVVVGELLEDIFAKASSLSTHDWVLVPGTTGTASIDRARITQALLQLCDNAAKYSPPGSRIELGATTSPAHAEFWVQDAGPGIPDGAEARIFERFGRIDTGRGIRGSGLGLPIVAAIAEAHGGTVALETSGAGSRFALVVPSRSQRQTFAGTAQS